MGWVWVGVRGVWALFDRQRHLIVLGVLIGVGRFWSRLYEHLWLKRLHGV